MYVYKYVCTSIEIDLSVEYTTLKLGLLDDRTTLKIELDRNE